MDTVDLFKTLDINMFILYYPKVEGHWLLDNLLGNIQWKNNWDEVCDKYPDRKQNKTQVLHLGSGYFSFEPLVLVKEKYIYI